MSADEQDTRRARTKTFTATRADKIAAVRFPSIKSGWGSWRKKKNKLKTEQPSKHVQETFAWHAPIGPGQVGDAARNGKRCSCVRSLSACICREEYGLE